MVGSPRVLLRSDCTDVERGTADSRDKALSPLSDASTIADPSSAAP